MKIKELPKEDRPREKALHYGIENISDVELLAILIGSGVKNKSALEIASSLLKTYPNLFALSKAKNGSLKNEFGLSQITALKLEAVFEFCSRINKPKYQGLDHFENTEQIAKRYAYLQNEEHEFLVMLMMNSKKRIIKEKIMYEGVSDSIELDIREVLVELAQTNTKYFLLIHNHPHEIISPSNEDIASTMILKEKASNIGARLIDHLIIYQNGYYSLLRKAKKT